MQMKKEAARALILGFLVVTALPTPSFDQTVVGKQAAAQARQAPAQIFQEDLQTLEALQRQADATSDDRLLAGLAAQAAGIEAAAQGAVAANSSAIAAVDRALQRNPPRRTETAPQRRARASLLARRSAAEAALGEARGAYSAASNTFSLIAERRRNEFSARVFRRSPSPISPQFWTSLFDAGATDIARLESMSFDAADTAVQAVEPKGLLGLAAGLLLGLFLLFPARWSLERLGRRATRRPGAHEGFARTTHALWIAGVDSILPGLAALVLHLGAQWGGLLSEKADALAGAAVIAVAWASAILALGRALVTDVEADWRLLSLPERSARRIRYSLWAVAIVTGAGSLLTRLNYIVGASVAATIATNCALSVAYSGVAGLILVSFSAGPASLEAPMSTTERARSSGWTLISLVLTLAIIATLGAVALGYTTLAVLISSQIFWLSLLGAVTYLLLRFIDDLCRALFQSKGLAARALLALFRFRRSTIDQIGVLSSAGLQLLILIGAATLALTPFGQSGNLLLADLGRLGGPIHIGSATISPAAIGAGVGSLIIGLAVVHLIRAWVVRRYLPVTDWDAGLRNSVGTGVGYLGVGITLLCALAAMGLGFQQIALIASALSLGIGFGLQQVVQNFVSGIILLIERPVKVGDWVKVDDVEGDIRRIRVRATEIQTFDRSMMIVPNSDLITKTVQNKTHGQPGGRLQLQLSIANPADARKAADLILTTAEGKERILKDPAPAIYIDSLANGGAVNFNCYLYVDNPRDVYKVRSEIYFEIIEAMQKSDIPLAGVAGPQNIVVEPGPAMQTILGAKRSG
jgi:small-conductance mechanosensitive channel